MGTSDTCDFEATDLKEGKQYLFRVKVSSFELNFFEFLEKLKKLFKYRP